MALDLFLGLRKRNWAREPDRKLTSVQVPSVLVEPRLASAVKQAVALDSAVSVRPRGRGLVVTRKWKWG